MLPVIESRPNPPNTWVFSQGTNFNMARHHILPYNTLRDLWNLLVARFADTQLPEARIVVRQFLMLCNNRLANVDGYLDPLRRDQLNIVECNLLQETVAWPAWNIVWGPDSRSDNPADRYLDRFTFGITQEEFARMGVIEGLYHAFEQFKALAQPQAPHLRALADTINVARSSFVFVNGPIPFRPEMWEREADGRWHKRRSGEQFLRAASR